MEGMKEVFDIKLHREYLQFKESMLMQGKDELFASCYKIDVYRNLYEIMGGLAGRMPDAMLETLYWKTGLLDWLYESWVKVEDSYYGELKMHVEKAVLNYNLWGKEGGADGRGKERKAADGIRD